jgi:protein-tyrosine phosphatase
MEVFPIDDLKRVFISPDVDDWKSIEQNNITAIIDLDGDLDIGVPSVPNHLVYVYFPILDGELPDLKKLHAVARLGANLVEHGHNVLSHCGMGFNRSALVAGLILTHLGMEGKEVVRLLQEKRPGALFNEKFCAYLQSMPQSPKP